MGRNQKLYLRLEELEEELRGLLRGIQASCGQRFVVVLLLETLAQSGWKALAQSVAQLDTLRKRLNGYGRNLEKTRKCLWLLNDSDPRTVKKRG